MMGLGRKRFHAVRSSEEALRIYFGLLSAEVRTALWEAPNLEARRDVGEHALSRLALVAELAPAGELRTKTYALADTIASNLDLQLPWEDLADVR